MFGDHGIILLSPGWPFEPAQRYVWAHEERASVERAPKSAKVESPWCVLVPAYRPAFNT